MDKFQELKAEYDSLETFLRESLPGVNLGEAPLLYFLSATLKIWGSNVLYSPDYTTLLSCISGSTYTIEQVVTAMGCCGDDERQLMIPDFYEALVNRDRDRGSDLASTFIEKLNDLLVASAMINGDFTVEEANCLSTILAGLSRRALSAGVSIGDVPDYRLKVTEKKEDSYLQNDALVQAARERVVQKKEQTPSASTGDVNIPVTINVNLTADTDNVVKSSDMQTAAPEEAPSVTQPKNDENETLESLLAELDGLVGLESVKQDVHSLMNFIKVTKIREKRGMRVPTISYHLVFTGNPGTGKTTIARLMAKLYYHMGILPQGQLVETDRSALVAGYLGQTAIKTQKVIQEAMGGVLFIDEAYSLAGETDDSYGKEAIETILKAMEDHRDELVVIVAGYTELMHKFIESNPGLSSRFSKYFEFPDYTGEELLSIFNRFCVKNGYALDEEATTILKSRFDQLFASRDEHFGNARTARNIFEKAINAQADRIAMLEDISDSDLELITARDIASALGGVAG
ncbi:MAG: AAA family ATPase [Eubacteriales bacterium]